MLSRVKLKELEYVEACWLSSLTENGSFPNKKSWAENSPMGKFVCIYLRELWVEIRYMLLINGRKGVEVEERLQTINKYPTSGSEGKVAAGTGLQAKGLINDSSVVWRWFYTQSYSSPLGPERLKSILLPYKFTDYKSNMRHLEEYPSFI